MRNSFNSPLGAKCPRLATIRLCVRVLSEDPLHPPGLQ